MTHCDPYPAECEVNADCPPGKFCRYEYHCEPPATLPMCAPDPPPGYATSFVLSGGLAAPPVVTEAGPGRIALLDAGTNEVQVWTLDVATETAALDQTIAVPPETFWILGGELTGDGIVDLLLAQGGANPGVRLLQGEVGGGFTPLPSALPIDGIDDAGADLVGVALDIAPQTAGEEIFLGVPDSLLRTVISASSGTFASLWTSSDPQPMGASATLGRRTENGPIDLLYVTAVPDALWRYHGYGDGTFGAVGVETDDGLDGEGKRALTGVQIPSAGPWVVEALTIHGTPAVSIVGGVVQPRIVPGPDAASDPRVVGLDGDDAEPARVAVFGSGGLPLSILQIDSNIPPRFDCLEGTLADLDTVHAAAAVDADGNGAARDLAVVRAVPNGYEIVVVPR